MGHGGSHLSRHATFFAYAVAPVYALLPGSETLLALQAAMLGATALPMHLSLRRHLPHATSALLCILYLGYPPLHGANLYDFHFLPMGGFFLWLLFYAVETRRTWLTVVAAVLGIAVREDVAACIAVLGVFLFLTGRQPRTSLALAVAGGAYCLVMKLCVMPRFAHEGETFVGQYAGLLPPGEHSFGSILKTIVANPPFTANVLFERDKLVYVMHLFVPVLFLPWRRPAALLLFLPATLFTLLGTGYWPLSQISFQYTAYWTPFVFLLTGLELERVGRAMHRGDAAGPARRRAILAGIVGASLACSYVYGAIVPHEEVRAGFNPLRRQPTDVDRHLRQELTELLPQIPSRASIAASERLLPHVSSRPDAYTLRFGVLDASYLLFEVPPRGDEKGSLVDLLRAATFGVIEDKGDIVLAARGYDTQKNAAVVAHLRR
jgi:uncharacterized membrane protein